LPEPVSPFSLFHVTHDTDRLAGGAVFEGDHDGVLTGLLAEEVHRVVVFVLAGVIGGEDHPAAVEDTDHRLAGGIAHVEPVDVIAA